MLNVKSVTTAKRLHLAIVQAITGWFHLKIMMSVATALGQAASNVTTRTYTDMMDAVLFALSTKHMHVLEDHLLRKTPARMEGVVILFSGNAEFAHRIQSAILRGTRCHM